MAAEECLITFIPNDVQISYVEVGVLRARNLVALAELFPLMTITGVDSYLPYTDPAHGNYRVSEKLSALNKKYAIYAIDNSPNRERIKLIQKDSEEYSNEVPSESLDVVFLDKGFDSIGQAQDIRDWYPKVKVGGILCGHDAWTPAILDGVIQGLLDVGEKIDTMNIVNREVWYIYKS